MEDNGCLKEFYPSYSPWVKMTQESKIKNGGLGDLFDPHIDANKNGFPLIQVSVC